MGTTCGCAAGETRIKGETMDHGHWHVHADGSAHAHAAAAVDEGGALHYGHGAAGAHARCVNPALPVIRVSATSGEGFGEWTAWLENGLAAQRARKQETVAALRRRIAELEAQLAGAAR